MFKRLLVGLFFCASSALAAEDQSSFLGLNFGVGLSVTMDVGRRDRVESATIVNGIVRVTEVNNYPVRMLLESHYFFSPKSELFGLPSTRWGWGPFVAIQPGSGNLIEAYALGLMLGLKRADGGNFTGWSFGLGVIMDPNTKTLGDGFHPNQPAPQGETEVRYTTRAQGGIVALTSFSW